MLKRSLVIALALMMLFYLVPLMAQMEETEDEPDKEVVVSGEGVLAGSTEHRAKQDALNDAKRAAVEQAVGTLVTSNTLVENFQTIQDQIYTQSSGYIKSYDILQEGPTGSTYKMMIKAVVTVANIKNDLVALNILQAAMHRPRIVVRITGSPGLNRVAEKAVGKAFVAKEFNLVTASEAEVKIKGTLSTAAKDMGEEFAGMISCSAGLDLQAVKVANGKVLTSQEGSAKTVHIKKIDGMRKATLEASGKVAEALIEQIVESWNQEISQGSSIQVNITGAKYKQFAALKKGLTKITKVKDVHQRSFASGKAVIDVDYRGQTDDLVEDLMRLRFKSFELEVTGVKTGRIDLKAAQKVKKVQ